MFRETNILVFDGKSNQWKTSCRIAENVEVSIKALIE
jgi:hypothetical protein